jgi:hypothetical protein
MESRMKNRLVFWTPLFCAACLLLSCATGGKPLAAQDSEVVVIDDVGEVDFSIDDSNGKIVFPIGNVRTPNGGRKVYNSFVLPKGEFVIVPVPNGSYSIRQHNFSVQNERIYIVIEKEKDVIKAQTLGSTGMDVLVRTRDEVETVRADFANKIEAAYKAAAHSAYTGMDASLSAGLKKNAAIALFPLTAATIQERDILYEYITMEFANTGTYTLIEKSRVDEILAEHDFQKGGMVSVETMTVGELLGADAVIFASVNGSGGNKKLVTWVVDIKKRTLLATAQAEI